MVGLEIPAGMETVKADQRGREGNGERTAPCLWAVGVWRNDHMASEVAAAVARKQGAVEDRADLDDADDEAEEDDKEAVESGRRHQAGEDSLPARVTTRLRVRQQYFIFPENPQIVHRLHSGRLLNGPCLSSTHAGHRELAPRGMARRACFARILRLTDCATGRRARLPGDRTLDHLTHLTPVDLFFPPSPPSPPSGSYLPPTMAPTCLTTALIF